MKKSGWYYLILGILIPLVFQKAFVAQYVLWDDNALVLENPLLKLPFWEALKAALSVYYHGDYFPLTLMSYWFDVQVAGTSAFFQHCENLVLHMAASFLLLSCLHKLTKNLGLSFLVSLVFAIHPLQTESVMWISERKSLLSAVFTFLSLRFYLQSFDGRKKVLWLSGALLFFICAGLTKATALLMPVIFVMLEIHFGSDSIRRWGKNLAPFVVAATVLIVLRMQAYSASVGGSPIEAYSAEYLMTVPVRAFNAIAMYAGFFFVPLQSSAIYPDFAMNAVTLTAAAVALVVCIGITLWVRRAGNVLPRFAWLWFWLMLLPVLQIVPRINYINERYMYLPIVGVAGLLLSRLKPKYYLAVGIVAGLAMAGLSYVRSEMWTTNRELWVQTLKTVPESAIALNNLGLEYQNSGNFGEAAMLYQKVLQAPKDDGNKILAYNNLANVYAESRYAGFSLERATGVLREGIAHATRVRDTYEMRVNLGSMLMVMGQRDLARTVFTDVLRDLQQESDFRFQYLRPIVEERLRGL